MKIGGRRTERVVVTGVGAVGAWGAGRQALTSALAAGQPITHEVDRSAGYHRAQGSRRAALLGDLDLSALVPPAAARRMGPSSRLAVAAARLAMDDAGIEIHDPAWTRTGVVMATAFGPAWFTERLLDAILHQGPESASPALFTESVASAAAAQVALNFQALGPSLTVTQREAGPLMAVAQAARLLRLGKADRVLAGSVEEMTPLLHSILDRFAALATPDADGREIARPFDRRRNGFLAAEGATVLVLEREGDRPQAPPLCAVAATGAAFDPTAPASGWGRGAAGLAARMAAELDRAGRPIAEIDRIVSGASGAVAGDWVEARTLRELWNGRSLPPIHAPKGVVGEYGGGLLGAAALLAGGAASGPTAGFAEEDRDLGIVPHDGTPLLPPERTLALTCAAGGAAAWVLWERA